MTFMELQTLSKVVQMISNGLQNDAAIAIADRRRFIYYQPGKSIDLPIHPGDALREGTVSHQAVQAQADVSTLVDPNVFGIPYFATGQPIIENNQLAGCVTAIFPIQKTNTIDPIQQVPLLIGKTEDRFVPIAFDDIHWIYADNRKTYLYTDHGDFQNKYTLSQLEQLLPAGRFLRCHRSYIVKLDSIAEIHPYFHSTFQLVIKDKHASRIPVSQSYASAFRDYLGF
jgi:two-component system, LytTR family, response regulator